MNTQTKRLVSIVAAGLLLGSAGAMAYGGGHGSDRAGCGEGRPMHALQQLDNVTDAQRAELRKLFEAQREARRTQRDAMRESRKAIREAIASGADTKQIQALADKQGQQVAARIMARAEMQRKIAAILTPEQLKELQDYRAQQQERRTRW